MSYILEHSGTRRFEIKKRLGAGGMGVVYEAFDRERGTAVALKTLTSLDPSSLYRFKREFRAVADVVHENLVELYELVSEDDQWFFSMELVPSATDFLDWVWGSPSSSEHTASGLLLKKRLPTPASPDAATEPMPWGSSPSERGSRLSETAGISSSGPRPDLRRLREGFRQLLNGLLAVHGAGLLHRDVKPSNVLVTQDGRVVLCDFGIVADNGERVMNGFIMGTPAYMAPEQASCGTALPAADWYAAGVMLFEALTG
ncbi:MAG: serine/threonine-protein kinase, partial [Polyangiaceae bacterium]